MPKKKKLKNKIEELPPEILKHIDDLGLSSIKEYKKWCKNHHLPSGIDKGLRQLHLERTVHTRTKATNKLKSSKSNLNLQNIIKHIYSGDANKNNLNDEISIAIFNEFQENEKRKNILLDTLLFLESISKLLQQTLYVRAISNLVKHYEKWVRQVTEWKPKTHNAERQFSSLARHLLAKYNIPIFMDSSWFDVDRDQQNWFIHIGTGGNIRTATGIPIKLTKKIAHFFLTAPDHYTVNEAFRWGQVPCSGR